MNPDKMRDDYAKLIFVLQDITVNSINEEIGVSLLRPVETVYRYLERKNLLELLDDELIHIAVSEIIPDGKVSWNFHSKRTRQAVSAFSASIINSGFNFFNNFRNCL